MGGFGGSMGGTQGGKTGKRPIGVKFEIPYFTTSGIQVRYLKIIEPKVCAMRRLGRGRITNEWNSCNIRVCRGCGISRRVGTLL